MSTIASKHDVAENGLPPFDPDSLCPKCRHDDIATSYRAACSCQDGWSCPAEALIRHCRRCRFEWAEAPA